MIHVIVRERDATAQATEPITSGSVGLDCRFRFSEDWEGLGKVAIFQGSMQIIDVALVGQESCVVPHEVLERALGHLKIGVYGTGDQGQRVTPTVWADAGRILPGVEPSEIEPTPATQSLVQQILEAAENAEEIAQGVRDDADAGEFDGADGVSPSVSVTDITGGHRVTIVDAQGTHVFDVMNGEKGDPGSGGDNVFWATYNSTTEAEITAAVTAGKTVLCKISDEIFYLASKAAIGPSGSAWIFASANQTSMRVTWVSGSYWNSIGTRTIPTNTSDLTNDSGFVNASGAAAAAPVQSVNGQTGAVTVATIPSGGSHMQFLTPDLFSSDTYVWSDLPADATALDFVLDSSYNVTSGPIWNDIDQGLADGGIVVAHVTTADGDEWFLPLTCYREASPGQTWKAEFAGMGADSYLNIITSGSALNTWSYTSVDFASDIADLAANKLNKNLGTAHAGEFLVVGSDGNITTVTMTAWQGGSY